MRHRTDRPHRRDPDVVLLTIEEAAAMLRIGRSPAYAFANVF